LGRPAFKQCDLDRVIRTMQARGLSVAAVEISVDGALRVLTGKPAPGVALNDDDDWVSLAGQAQDHGRA